MFKPYLKWHRYNSKIFGLELHHPILELNEPNRIWEAWFIALTVFSNELRLGIIKEK